MKKALNNSFQLQGPVGNLATQLLLPPGFNKETGKCDLVILMHGFLGSMTGAPMGFLGKLFPHHGYAVLRFDFDGYGHSEGTQEGNTVPKMIEDAQVMYDYARKLPFVNRVILLGHSQGGVVASMLSGRLEKAGTPPDGLILMAPAYVIKDFALKGRFFTTRCNPQNPPESVNVYGFHIGREYILTAQTLPIEEESSWFTGPVLLLHGTWDIVVPPVYSKRYHALYRNSELHFIRWTEHIFLFFRRSLRRHLLDFLSALSR